MYEHLPINLIIWMAKRNITNSVFADKVGCVRQQILDIKKGILEGIFGGLTEALLDKFARELKIDKHQLIAPPEPVEIAYLPVVLNDYIVCKPKPVSVLVREIVDFTPGLIDQIRLKYSDREKPEIVEAKKKLAEELSPTRIGALEAQMGIRFTRNGVFISNTNTSSNNANRSSGSETLTSDDNTSHSSYRQKRSCPESSSISAPTEPSSDSNKRQQISGLGAPTLADETPLLARVDALEQGQLSPHQAPSPQPTPYIHGVINQPPANPVLEQLLKEFEEVKQQLKETRANQTPSPLPAPDESEMAQLRAERDALKQQLRESRANQTPSPLPAPDESEVAQLRAELDVLKQQRSQPTVLPSLSPSSVDETALLQKVLGALDYQRSQSSFYQVPSYQSVLLGQVEQIAKLSAQVAALERQLSYTPQSLAPGHFYFPPTAVSQSGGHMSPTYQQQSARHAAPVGMREAYDPHAALFPEYHYPVPQPRPMFTDQSGFTSPWQSGYSQPSAQDTNLAYPSPSTSGHFAHPIPSTMGPDHRSTHADNPLPELPVTPSSGQSSPSSQTQTPLSGAGSRSATFFHSSPVLPPLSVPSSMEGGHGSTPSTNQQVSQQSGRFAPGNAQSHAALVRSRSMLDNYSPILSPAPGRQSPIVELALRKHSKSKTLQLSSSSTQSSRRDSSSLPSTPSRGAFSNSPH